MRDGVSTPNVQVFHRTFTGLATTLELPVVIAGRKYMNPGLGPREYQVEPEAKPFWSRAVVKIAGAIVLVAAVGLGGFGIAHALSGSTPAAAKAPVPSSGSSNATPPSGSGNAGAVGGLGAGRLGDVVIGTVKSIGSNSFTVTLRARGIGVGATGGTATVDVASSTAFRTSSGPTTFSALKVGDNVGVASKSTSTPYTATTVTIIPAGVGVGGGRGFGGGAFGRGGTFGTVASVESGSFTVQGRTRGSTGTSTVIVKVTSSTTYGDSGSTSASFADVKVGTRVLVVGTTSGSTLTATSVTIVPATGFGGGGFGGGGATPSS
jgi:hypothetical protein